MPPVTGKTVYVLGAGASAHTGAPFLNDFLVKAKDLHTGNKSLKYKKSFQRVFDWVNQLRGTAYHMGMDLDNIEHVFSLAEMKKQLGLKNGEILYEDLLNVITETLDVCELTCQGYETKPDDLYSRFVEYYFKLNESRMSRLGQTIPEFKRDVIITFNYDLMLDNAFYHHENDCIHYGVKKSRIPLTVLAKRVKIFKIHGSTNWGRCSKCKELSVQILPPIYEGGVPDPHINPQEVKKVQFKMSTQIMPKTQCVICKEEESLRPYIIPPTWSKDVNASPLINVWKSAINEIKDAFQIVVIGYSLPSTDTFFQYLITLGLEDETNLHRVFIVNPDNSEECKNRYRNVFRALDNRKGLNFVQNTFYKYVVNLMKTFGETF